MINQLSVQVLDAEKLNMSTSQQTPNPQDVIDFNNAMNNDATEIQVIEGDAAKVQGDVTVGNTDGIGATVVKKLEEIRAEAKQQLKEINSVMGRAVNDGVNAKELLQLQVKVFQFTYQTHITTKVSDKTNEGIKTLFRQQG